MGRPVARPLAALSLLLAAMACDGSPQDPPLPEASADEDLDERLSAIGYVAGTDLAGPRSGVLRHEAQRVSPGLNLFTSGHGPVALLMDMEGRVLHEWRADFRELFPLHPDAARGGDPDRQFWRVARLLPNGDLIAIWELYGIFKLDRHSRIVWVVPGNAHHDLQVAGDGRIHHLEAARRWMPEIEGRRAIEDFVVARGPGGRELSRLAISKALGNAGWPDLRKIFWLRNVARDYGLGDRARFDPFHTNALRILSPGEARTLGAPFEAGDALVSMAMLDTIAILDTVRGSARWWQQGPFSMQHQPRVAPDEGIVLFNNHRAAERSSVQILDPRTRRITWEYGGQASEPLYSKRSGGAEILENGNVLIVETDRGRALEVSRDKEIVWEFRSPFRAGKSGDRVAHLYALERVPESELGWLVR